MGRTRTKAKTRSRASRTSRDVDAIAAEMIRTQRHGPRSKMAACEGAIALAETLVRALERRGIKDGEGFASQICAALRREVGFDGNALCVQRWLRQRREARGDE